MTIIVVLLVLCHRVERDDFFHVSLANTDCTADTELLTHLNFDL